MTPTSGESKTCHCSSRTRALRNLRPSASGKASSTRGQSQAGERSEAERGAGCHLGLQGSPHPLVRWKTFHDNLLLYQQRLEAALEMHTLSSELDDVTEQIREKVDSEKSPCALSWEWQCLESPVTPVPGPPLLFSWVPLGAHQRI